ncbi:MAG: CDP-diacylglycerol--glycerol-3-phosphate 3-phosphatidyltransferase [Clostridiales Family XIII bacterium]|jgi:CDP-diacylglycerol--glycerol-3-phosphate 3-phosphatidyltransferase|nr:CDP-diacylglycerol--glycerol-3-phosphate 3-phosphatidyltransferase [Clostridiales Family XIII bacterium]
MRFKNLPNALTLMRVLLIPVFIVALMTGRDLAAGLVFVIASLTDLLDGYIARKYDLVTNFGKLMDPLADKLLMMSALVCLVELGEIRAWMVVVMLGREFAVTGLRSVAAGEGHVLAAAFSGKLKTFVQALAILALVLRNRPFESIGLPVAAVLLWAALLLTVYSGAEFIVKNRKLLSWKQS